MKFTISSFQVEPEFAYDISHKVIGYLNQRISKFISEVTHDFDLVFSISCHLDNPDEVIVKGQMRGRKKPKEITQFLSFPNKELQLEDDWLFDLNSFDFIRTKNAYQTYPLDKYVAFTIESLIQILNKEEIESNLDFHELRKELVDYFESNTAEYKYLNPMLIHLEELINGTHFSYTRNDGMQWQESEIGKKWMRLKDKYYFDSNKELALK